MRTGSSNLTDEPGFLERIQVRSRIATVPAPEHAGARAGKTPAR